MILSSRGIPACPLLKQQHTCMGIACRTAPKELATLGFMGWLVMGLYAGC